MDILNIKFEEDGKKMNISELYRLILKMYKKENGEYKNKEHLWIVSLNDKKRIISVDLALVGDNEKIKDINSRDVFASAIRRNGSYIILAHNHPGDILAPSKDDVKMTDKFYQMGVVLNIRIIDHMIITTEGYVSFEELGFIRKFERSLKYAAPYEKKNKIDKMRTEAKEDGYYRGFKAGRKEGIKVGKEENRHEGIETGIRKGKILGMRYGIKEGFARGYNEGIKFGVIEAAKRMYKKGMNEFDVMFFTGISKKELNNISKRNK